MIRKPLFHSDMATAHLSWEWSGAEAWGSPKVCPGILAIRRRLARPFVSGVWTPPHPEPPRVDHFLTAAALITAAIGKTRQRDQHQAEAASWSSATRPCGYEDHKAQSSARDPRGRGRGRPACTIPHFEVKPSQARGLETQGEVFLLRGGLSCPNRVSPCSPPSRHGRQTRQAERSAPLTLTLSFTDYTQTEYVLLLSRGRSTNHRGAYTKAS